MTAAVISARDLTLHDERGVVLRDVSFDVQRGELFAITGGIGSGKRTLLAALVGLVKPDAGEVRIIDRFGVVFHSGALWRDLTLRENVALPLQQLTHLSRREIRELAELELELVGVADAADSYPDQVRSDVLERAALARALVLDPKILFFDEPTEDLDPLSARGLCDLIVELRDSLSLTVVIVSHDLASIFAIASDGIHLDHEMVAARGNPKQMLRRTSWKELT